jgi:hypothetical protein
MPQRALELWNTMTSPPSKTTYVAVLLACAETAALQQGKLAHDNLTQQNINLDQIIATSLINMYAKAGSLDDANKVSFL